MYSTSSNSNSIKYKVGLFSDFDIKVTLYLTCANKNKIIKSYKAQKVINFINFDFLLIQLTK